MSEKYTVITEKAQQRMLSFSRLLRFTLLDKHVYFAEKSNEDFQNTNIRSWGEEVGQSG